MTQKTKRSAGRANASQTGYQTDRSNTNRINHADADSKAIHEELTRSPYEWRTALRKAGLPASGLVVGLALVDEFLNRKDGRCFPSYEAIATACRISSIRTIRAGVDALRRAGLISTRKTKFDGSLSYSLRLPDNVRSVINMSVRIDDEVAVLCPSKGQKSDARSDGNLPLNLRIEPKKITVESSYVPLQSGGGAFGSPSDDSPVGRIPPLVRARPLASDVHFEEDQTETLLTDLDFVRSWLAENCPDRAKIPRTLNWPPPANFDGNTWWSWRHDAATESFRLGSKPSEWRYHRRCTLPFRKGRHRRPSVRKTANTRKNFRDGRERARCSMTGYVRLEGRLWRFLWGTQEEEKTPPPGVGPETIKRAIELGLVKSYKKAGFSDRIYWHNTELGEQLLHAGLSRGRKPPKYWGASRGKNKKVDR